MRVISNGSEETLKALDREAEKLIVELLELLKFPSVNRDPSFLALLDDALRVAKARAQGESTRIMKKEEFQ